MGGSTQAKSHRRAPWYDRWQQAPITVVLVVLAVGIAGIADHHWRKGLYVVGLGLVLAAVLRLLLPARRAGLLVVRSRPLDVLILGGLGGGIGVLATIIPPVLP